MRCLMTGFFHKHSDFEVHPCGTVSVLHTFLWPSHIPLYGWSASLMAPGGTSGKESACNAGDATDTGPIPGSGRSPGGGMATHVSILPGKLHGQRSPVARSPIHYSFLKNTIFQEPVLRRHDVISHLALMEGFVRDECHCLTLSPPPPAEP